MTTVKKTPASLTVLRAFAVLAAVASVAQAALGGMLVTNNAVRDAHSSLATVTLVATVVAAVAAGMFAKSGGSKGLLWHSLGMAILALVQFALGEMGMTMVHITVGVAFMVGAIALATLSFRKPWEENTSTDVA